MRKVLLKLWLGLALLTAADARAGQIISDQGVFAASATYQGPGDIISGWAVWGSCARAYSGTFAATLGAVCDVVDTATGLTTCTFHIQVSGFVNPSECNATACATACKVTKLYDQSGNGRDLINATLAQMPSLTLSGLNGLPVMTGPSGVTILVTGAFGQAAPYTLSAVYERTAAFTTKGMIVGSSAAVEGLYSGGSADLVILASTTEVTAAATDSAWHSVNGFVSNSAGACATNVDGSDVAGLTCGTTALATSVRIFRSSSGAQLQGQIAEIGVYPGATDATQRGNINTNQHSAVYGYNF